METKEFSNQISSYFHLHLTLCTQMAFNHYSCWL